MSIQKIYHRAFWFLIFFALFLSIDHFLEHETVYAAELVEVHRFWSDRYKHHFYTALEQEKNEIIANDLSWQYEGVAYLANSGAHLDSEPMYRFWSPVFLGHFYTKNVDERNSLITRDKNWLYEGIAFFVLSESDDAVPVFRFWNELTKGHFYTLNVDERDKLIAESSEWIYEGVAFFASVQDDPESPTNPTVYCGLDHGKTLAAPPTNILCINGSTPVQQTGDGPWRWACSKSGQIVSVCKADSISVIETSAGVCANIGSVASQPSGTQACSSGVYIPAASSATDWNWGCLGTGENAFVVCSAPKL